MLAKVSMALVLLLGLSGSAQSSDKPTEFLDERTGATVTIVHEPLVFPLGRAAFSLDEQREFVSFTAIEIDRSGEIQLYVIGFAWSPRDRLSKPVALHTDERELQLVPLVEFPKDLPADRTLLAPAPSHVQRAAYVVTRDLLREIGGAKSLTLSLSTEAESKAADQGPFDVWGGQKSLIAFVDHVGVYP